MFGGLAEIQVLGHGAENLEAKIFQLGHGDDYLSFRELRGRHVLHTKSAEFPLFSAGHFIAWPFSAWHGSEKARLFLRLRGLRRLCLLEWRG